jgi:hypothetical protein
MFQPRTWLLATLVLYAAMMKLLPYAFGIWDPNSAYPWNFSPVYAVCLFGGAYFVRREQAFLVPLAAWLLGDLGIWAITGRFAWAFYPNQFLVYGSLCLLVGLGTRIPRRYSFRHVAAAGVGGALAFFLITNFGAWLTGTTYAKTWAGLVECYVAGIPYFRNSLVGTAAYGALLFHPAVVKLLATDAQRVHVAATD